MRDREKKERERARLREERPCDRKCETEKKRERESARWVLTEHIDRKLD